MEDAAEARYLAVVTRLEARIDELEARLASLAGPAPAPVTSGETRTTRRDLMRLAGLTAAGALAATATTVRPAAAADDDLLQIGNPGNAASTLTTLQTLADWAGSTLVSLNASTGGHGLNVRGLLTTGAGSGEGMRSNGGTGTLGSPSGGTGVLGVGGTAQTGGDPGTGVTGTAGSGGSGNANGVMGFGRGVSAGISGIGGGSNGPGIAGQGGVPNGVGVAGVGTGTGPGATGLGGPGSGVGVQATGGAPNGGGLLATGVGTGIGIVAGAAAGAPLRLVPKGVPGPPTSGAHVAGELWVDSANTVWVCIASATPGTWARLTTVIGAATGGAITMLPKPIRLLDTREASGGAALYQAGVAHELLVANGPDINDAGSVRIPTAASAAILNVTVTETQGRGHIRIYPNSITVPNVSTLNYSTANLDLANGTTVGLVAGKVGVFVATSATHLIIDAVGYIA